MVKTHSMSRGSGSSGADSGNHDGSLPPGSTGPTDPSPGPSPDGKPMRVQIVMTGPQAGVQHIINCLHLHQMVERVKWSTPMPTKEPDEFVTLLYYAVRLG